MKDETPAAVIRILEKEYRVACPADEREALDASVRLVDHKMREIRATGKVIGSDRIAVMAALNLAHELLLARSSQDFTAQNINRRIRQLQDRIDGALEARNELEV